MDDQSVIDDGDFEAVTDGFEGSGTVDVVDDGSDGGEPEVVVKHTRATRWMHWINFPVLTIMIWSGIRIYWAFDVSRIPSIRFGEETLFPEGFYDVLVLDRKLARGMAWHFSFGWFFLINGVIFISYLFASGRWRELFPTREDFQNLWGTCLLYTSPSPRDQRGSRMPSSA